MEEFIYMGNGQSVPTDVVSIRFDPSVTAVEEDAFRDCTQLRELVLNEGLRTIGKGAFIYGCLLQNITFPSTLVEIDSYVFAACHNLKKVVFNEGLRKIGGCAFGNCSSLWSVTIPSTLSEIGSFAFSRCCCLKEVTMNGMTFHFNEKIEPDAFEDCPQFERFTFPIISTRLNNIIQTGHYPEVQNIIGLYVIRGDMIERRGSELFVSKTVMKRFRGLGWNTVKQSIDQLINWISYYEMRESTSLFELALWKSNLDQVDDTSPTNRELCRIEVPGPVKDTILQYLS